MNIEEFAYDLHSHTFRAASHFCTSLHFLKEKRGGQAWNEIANDAVDLYRNSTLETKPFSNETLWTILFEPPELKSEKFYDVYTFFLKYQKLKDYFCSILLYAMTDPPKEWWDFHRKI